MTNRPLWRHGRLTIAAALIAALGWIVTTIFHPDLYTILAAITVNGMAASIFASQMVVKLLEEELAGRQGES